MTGIGVAAPNGVGTDHFWAATLAGRPAIAPVKSFDASPYPHQLGAEISDFDPADHLPSRLLTQTDRMTQIALAVSDWAMRDAAIPEGLYGSAEIGVVTAAAYGGFDFGQRELHQLWQSGPQHVSVYMSFAWFYAVNSGQVSIRHGLRGPSNVIVSDQAGGLDCFAIARRNLRNGMRAVIAGGIESSFCPYGWVSRMSARDLSPSTDPETAYVPFDVRAQGHVPGEGGAFLVLEATSAAVARGARVYGEVVGHGATFDATPGHGRQGEPNGLMRAATVAICEAGLKPSDIGVVFADGAGTPRADEVEADTITALFGARSVPVTVPKTMVGRMCSGGPALDVATALLAFTERQLPPTVNSVMPSREDLDLVVSESRPWVPAPALILARGQGGFNSALVVQPPPT